LNAIRDRIKELRRVKASELIPHERNWRRHPKAQQAALRAMLEEVGYAGALLARETDGGRLQLIDGHLRAETTPDQLVPVLVLDVNEDEADKLLLTFDPLASLATIDEANLQALIEATKFDNDELSKLVCSMHDINLDPLELDDPSADLDQAAELQKKWGTKLGQVWQIGRHWILCGDSRNEAEIALLWHNAPKFRMVWTDPPYGVDYAGKYEYLNRGDRGNRIQKAIENDRLSAEECQTLFAGALIQAQVWAVPGAVCYATVPSGPLLVALHRRILRGRV
jgi:hypothetical protein